MTVADTAHRWFDARLGQPLAVADRDLLGEFSQSLQHILNQGVDENKEVEGGSAFAIEVALTGSTASVTSSSAMALLEGDRQRALKR